MKQATQDILMKACPAMYADIFTVIDDTMLGTKKYWKQQFSSNVLPYIEEDEYYYKDTLDYDYNQHDYKQKCNMYIKILIGGNNNFPLGINTTSGRQNY